MFSWWLHRDYLAPIDDAWEPLHGWILRGLGLYLDLLLVFIIITAACALMSLAPAGVARREQGIAGVERIRAWLTRLDRWVLFVSALCLIGMVSVTTLSVLGRAFGQSIPDDITFAEWFMVGLVCLMLGPTQGRGEHIEVTALADRFPLRVRQLVRLMACLIGLVTLGLFVHVNLVEVPDSFLEETYGSIYELPMWPARLVFFIGIAWWLARTAAQAVILLLALPSSAGLHQRELIPLLALESGIAHEESMRYAAGELDGDSDTYRPPAGH